MTEKCDTKCEQYLVDAEICMTGKRAPCYIPSGEECVAPSLKIIKPSELEQSAQSSDHPFGEWGKGPLPFP